MLSLDLTAFRLALVVMPSRNMCPPLPSHPHPPAGPRPAQVRYTAQQHERAQHAMQVKLSLLEEQLAATAESARRRMEEQLDTFRGDAATAR